jgi:peptide deformylase
MMRSIAIGLAAVTIAIGGSTLSASAFHGQASDIDKGSVSRSIKPHHFGPRTYGFYEGEGAHSSPREREHVGSIMREVFAELSPRQREHLRGAIRERMAGLTPHEREHLRGVMRERFAELTPRERAYLRGIIRQRIAELNPREGADITRIERERFHRHGPYGRR